MMLRVVNLASTKLVPLCTLNIGLKIHIIIKYYYEFRYRRLHLIGTVIIGNMRYPCSVIDVFMMQNRL